MSRILKLVLTLILFSPDIEAHQQYSGNSALDCEETPPQSSPSPSVLYTCNGELHSCRAFLIFTVQFPYNTVAAIAALTLSDQAEVARTNNITRFAVLKPGQEVIVPVNCSCSGQSYQASTTYQITTSLETYYTIANDTFQGLSTCNALSRVNAADHSASSLQPGDELGVPLRCACPTTEQAAAGIKFLLTYPIAIGDTLNRLSKQFNISVTTVNEANGLSEESSTIYPFTTILIPLLSEPSWSYAVSRARGHDSITSSPLPAPVVPKKKSNHVPFAAGISAGAISLAIILLILLFLLCSKRKQMTQTRERNNKTVSSRQDLIIEIARLDRNLKVFKFTEIKKATGNFASKNRIDCSMYRGILRKQILAVQKNSRNADNEVRMLHQINHFNIVKLYGFCEHRDDLYLVYEYMENGALQEWLSRRAPEDLISWNHIIRIALDIANGLLYLHKFTNPAHVHNNISSSNILLDGNLRVSMQVQSLPRLTCLPSE